MGDGGRKLGVPACSDALVLHASLGAHAAHIEFSELPPEDRIFGAPPALSPDGRTLAYLAEDHVNPSGRAYGRDKMSSLGSESRGKSCPAGGGDRGRRECLLVAG